MPLSYENQGSGIVIIVDGEQGRAIHATDRAVMYGDGVFRTMRMRGGAIACWPLHYGKLDADCRALRIPCPMRTILEQDIARIARDVADCVVKIIISRGAGGRGYGVPKSLSPTRMVVASPVPDYPSHFWREGIKLHVCEIRLCHQPRLAGIKHLNRLENVLARMEWQDPDTPEGLLLDAEDCVVEGTMSNLFMRRGNTLITPDLSACGVAGLQRERILKYAARLDLKAEIARFSLPVLLAADEVFVCNSVIGVWPVRQIDAQPIALGHAAEYMQRLLENETD